MALLTRGVLAFVLGLALMGAASRATQAYSEYEVKAAFLCRFADFVEWPAPDPDPVTICVLGEDPFGRLLDQSARERGSKRSLVVARHTNIESARRCQIVFVSSSEKATLARTIRALEGTSTLTVSDIPDFATLGGVIGFTLEDKHIRFEINVEAASRARLRISSQLLKLARIVGGAGG